MQMYIHILHDCKCTSVTTLICFGDRFYMSIRYPIDKNKYNPIIPVSIVRFVSHSFLWCLNGIDPSPQIAISPNCHLPKNMHCWFPWLDFKTLPSPQKTSLEPNDWLVTCSHTMLPYLAGLWITFPKTQVNSVLIKLIKLQYEYDIGTNITHF